MRYRVLTACLLTLASAAGFSQAADFGNPVQVTISGLPNGPDGSPMNQEEPYISRNGKTLFFNGGAENNHRLLHYAERGANGGWTYRGQISLGGEDEKYVQGAPAIDVDNNLVFSDTGVDSMVRSGRFSGGKLSSVRAIDGLPPRKANAFARKFQGNMGPEVSPDSRVLYFTEAAWGAGGFMSGQLLRANIHFATHRGGATYYYDQSEVERVMENVNSRDIEYSPAISTDGLELFFTRILLADRANNRDRALIMRAVRGSTSQPFDSPVEVMGVGEDVMAEAPSISGDGSELYYQKTEGGKTRIYMVTR
ncbi:TolB family protein [Hahella sp. NBU794]|uniref:TolB family protein n=1 Tax=Hahella sp. NBU794 TaxID=3422590 RepID=UPI003D6EFF3F